MTQSFDIKENGQVKGGSLSYVYDPTIGKATYQGNIRVQVVWPVTINKSIGPLSYPIDPGLLLSAKYRNIGDTASAGGLVFRVFKVLPSQVGITITVPGQSHQWTALIDTSQEYISVIWLLAVANISLLTLTIEADEVTPGEPNFLIKLRQIVKETWGDIWE